MIATSTACDAGHSIAEIFQGDALEVLQVLHPLEERDGDAAGVGVDVGQHVDAAVTEDEVGGGYGGPVRGLHNVPRLDLARHVVCTSSETLLACSPRSRAAGQHSLARQRSLDNEVSHVWCPHCAQARCRACTLAMHSEKRDQSVWHRVTADSISHVAQAKQHGGKRCAPSMTPPSAAGTNTSHCTLKISSRKRCSPAGYCGMPPPL